MNILKEHWLPIMVLIVLIVLASIAINASNEAQNNKLSHATFMFDNRCIISIKDITLNRDGCLDSEQNVYWRKQ